MISENENTPRGYEDSDIEMWEKLRESIRDNDVPDNPIRKLLQGQTSYHILKRSCITMALTVIDTAHAHMYRKAGLPEPKRIRVVPGDMPEFVEDVAHGSRRSALLTLPSAIHWLMHNQTVIPSKAHELLDEVGLLRRSGDEIVKTHYDNRRETPYGRLHENLIY
jgi:hypothetical protein